MIRFATVSNAIRKSSKFSVRMVTSSYFIIFIEYNFAKLPCVDYVCTSGLAGYKVMDQSMKRPRHHGLARAWLRLKNLHKHECPGLF